MTTAEANKKREKGRLRSLAKFWISTLLVVVLIGYFAYRKWAMQRHGLEDFFVLLDQRGYTPNVGFSGVFRPGNVIQVAEEGADARDRALVTPLVVVWADKCFPNHNPRTLEFSLPQYEGESSANLTLTGDMLSRMLPSLEFDDKAVARYSLTLENVRIESFAKTDLSSEFSAPCVAALRTAIDAGDKVEWLRVVLEAIVADALTLQVDWSDNASMNAREKLANKAGKALTQNVTNSTGGNDPEVRVAVDTGDTRRTKVSARGLVIVGYRARPLQPVRSP
jgi:hypothetical protein